MSDSSRVHRDDHLWYKDAVFYELSIRSFYDSTGSGMGDIAGVVEKLGYLQELGVTALWFLPFFASPFRDGGYDIQDYLRVDPSLGTMDDFQLLIDAAHERGMKVVIELVLNHTSDQHAWFQRARHAPAGSVERDYYVWSNTAKNYSDARVIFSDYESSNWSWDPVANAYYWHRFYAHQPDLNFENPLVQQEILHVLDVWCARGVDGVRLDAVPYLFEEEGTDCENRPHTFDFIKTLRRHIDSQYPGCILLAEANQWPEDAVRYLAQDAGCHMAFHFPLMPRLFLALATEESMPVVSILERSKIPEQAQWALFLRNHDELTLEMVSEAEREILLQAYGQPPAGHINCGIRRRLAPLLGNDRRKLELMHTLLLTLPGSPVLYYGDEIGMGDDVSLPDRDGVRTPMQWNGGKNGGFSTAAPCDLVLPLVASEAYHWRNVNVAAAQKDTSSFYHWLRQMVMMRKKYPAFRRGSLAVYAYTSSSVLAFERNYKDERIFVGCNLSCMEQNVSFSFACSSEVSLKPLAAGASYAWENGICTVAFSPYQTILLLLE